MDSSAKLRLLSDSLPQPKHKGVSEMFAPFLTWFHNNQFPHQIVLVFFASWFFWWVVHLDAYTLSDLFSDECGWLYESFLRTHLPSDMIAIHAGIGAVLINIAFLVLGKLGNKSDPYEGQVLLKESMLSLLLTLEVAVFFVIGFWRTNVLAVGLLIVLGGFTLYRLWKTIFVLKNESAMERARTSILTEKFETWKTGFRYSIGANLGNQYLSERYPRWRKDIIVGHADSKEGYMAFNAEVSWRVENIDLLKLEALTPRRFGWLQQNADTNANTEAAKEIELPFCIVAPVFRWEVCASDALVWIREDAIRGSLPELNKEIREIFKIRENKNLIDGDAEVKLVLSRLKDSTLFAARNGDPGAFSRGLGQYRKLIKHWFDLFEEFLKESASLNQGTLDSAVSSVPGDSIVEDLYDIYESGISSGNKGIIHESAWIPFDVMIQSIAERESYLFGRFILFVVWGYESVLAYRKKGQSDSADRLFDQLLRHLSEISEWHLASSFKKGDLLAWQFEDYAHEILMTFQSLLKRSYDSDSFGDFKKFHGVLDELFESLAFSGRDPSIEGQRLIIEKRKSQLFFWLLAWFIYKARYSEGPKKWTEFLELMLDGDWGDMGRITNTFLDSRTFETEHIWHWESWEMEEVPGKVITIQVFPKLEVCYAVLGLRSYAANPGWNLSLQNSFDERVSNMMSHGSAFMDALGDFQSNPNHWIGGGILTEDEINQTSWFLAFLQERAKSFADERKRLIRSKDVSPERVRLFKEGMDRTYEWSKRLLGIFKLSDAIDDHVSEPYSWDAPLWWRSVLFDKEPFLPDWFPGRSTYHDFENGFTFWRVMAEGENAILLDKLKAKAQEFVLSGLVETLNRHRGPLFFVIFSSYEAMNRAAIAENPDYIEKWSEKFDIRWTEKYGPLISWVIRNNGIAHPVYLMPEDHAGSGGCLLLASEKSWRIQLLSPVPKGDSSDNVFEKTGLFMSVQGFSDDSDQMKQFLGSPPSWLDDKFNGDKELMRNHLKEKILIRLYRRFEYVSEKGDLVFYADLKD